MTANVFWRLTSGKYEKRKMRRPDSNQHFRGAWTSLAPCNPPQYRTFVRFIGPKICASPIIENAQHFLFPPALKGRGREWKKEIRKMFPATIREGHTIAARTVYALFRWEKLKQDAWSWWTGSNHRPVGYESTTLPTELHQQVFHIASQNCVSAGICGLTGALILIYHAGDVCPPV